MITLEIIIILSDLGNCRQTDYITYIRQSSSTVFGSGPAEHYHYDTLFQARTIFLVYCSPKDKLKPNLFLHRRYASYVIIEMTRVSSFTLQVIDIEQASIHFISLVTHFNNTRIAIENT